MFCIDQLGKYERVYPFHCSPCIQELAQKYDRTADSVTSKSDFRLESDRRSGRSFFRIQQVSLSQRGTAKGKRRSRNL